MNSDGPAYAILLIDRAQLKQPIWMLGRCGGPVGDPRAARAFRSREEAEECLEKLRSQGDRSSFRDVHRNRSGNEVCRGVYLMVIDRVEGVRCPRKPSTSTASPAG